MAGGDVKETELVGARGVIDPRLLDRIAGIGEVDEVNSLHDAPAGNVEAGNDADADGHWAAFTSVIPDLTRDPFPLGLMLSRSANGS